MAKKKRTSNVTPAQIVALRGSRSQVEFAALAEITDRQLQRYEAGEVAMSNLMFAALASLAPPLTQPE